MTLEHFKPFRKLVLVALLLSATFLGLECQQAIAEEIEPGFGSEKEIANELKVISENYEVGEFLSPEDAVFVMAHATPTENEKNTSARNSSSFSKTKTRYGTTVSAKGKIFHNGTVPSYSFGCDVTIKKTKGKTPKKLSFKATCTAFGIAAKDKGISITYKDSVSASKKNANSLRADLKKTYTGFSPLYSIDSYARITTHSGDVFTISD